MHDTLAMPILMAFIVAVMIVTSLGLSILTSTIVI